MLTTSPLQRVKTPSRSRWMRNVFHWCLLALFPPPLHNRAVCQSEESETQRLFKNTDMRGMFWMCSTIGTWQEICIFHIYFENVTWRPSFSVLDNMNKTFFTMTCFIKVHQNTGNEAWKKNRWPPSFGAWWVCVSGEVGWGGGGGGTTLCIVHIRSIMRFACFTTFSCVFLSCHFRSFYNLRLLEDHLLKDMNLALTMWVNLSESFFSSQHTLWSQYQLTLWCDRIGVMIFKRSWSLRLCFSIWPF